MDNQTQNNEAVAVVKSLADLPTAPQVFDNVESAANWIAARAQEGFDFASCPVVSHGLTDDGDLNPESFPARVAVHILRNRAVRVNGDLQPATVKAVCIYHLPTIDAAISAPDARDWITTILNTAMTRKAVAKLRDADNIEDVAETLPTEDADFWAESGRGGGGLLEAFEAVYSEIRALVLKFPVMAKAKISKADFKRALESRAFALALYPGGEELSIGGETRSLFLAAAMKGRQLAAAAGHDPAIFDRWIDTRDSVDIAPANETEDGEAIDFDSVFG